MCCKTFGYLTNDIFLACLDCTSTEISVSVDVLSVLLVWGDTTSTVDVVSDEDARPL